MEFIDGQTLSERISREGPLQEAQAREISRQICAGLAQAHHQSIIHGDLKCGNVMLSSCPQGGVRAVITDFGLAKMRLIEGAHVTGSGGGTRDYMAPELVLGERATVASDLYALGIIFHVMLTGHLPKHVGNGSPSEPYRPMIADSQAATITAGPVIDEAQWQRTIEELPSPWRRGYRTVSCPPPRESLPLCRRGKRSLGVPAVVGRGVQSRPRRWRWLLDIGSGAVGRQVPPCD